MLPKFCHFVLAFLVTASIITSSILLLVAMHLLLVASCSNKIGVNDSPVAQVVITRPASPVHRLTVQLLLAAKIAVWSSVTSIFAKPVGVQHARKESQRVRGTSVHTITPDLSSAKQAC